MKSLNLWKAKVVYCEGQYYAYEKTTSYRREEVIYVATASDSISGLSKEIKEHFEPERPPGHPNWAAVQSITEISHLGMALVAEERITNEHEQ